MKRIPILLLALLPISAFCADAPASPPDTIVIPPLASTESSLLRQQRDSNAHNFEEVQLQLILAQQQIKDLTAKVAELQKQIDNAKPNPAAKK